MPNLLIKRPLLFEGFQKNYLNSDYTMLTTNDIIEDVTDEEGYILWIWSAPSTNTGVLKSNCLLRFLDGTYHSLGSTQGGCLLSPGESIITPYMYYNDGYRMRFTGTIGDVLTYSQNRFYR